MDEPANSPPVEGTHSAPWAAKWVGEIVADRYRIDRLIGEGAMGAVFRAEHIHMQKLVALKVLHRETNANPEVVKRFEREAIAAGRIVHPHVATAQDFGQLADGSFYLVLEYVAGRSVRDLLEEEGALPVQRSILIAEQVATALAAAHQSGIVHRDLKPENVMLLGDSDGDFVKVLDFGLAKLGQDDGTDTKLTKMGAVYGTPQYMAPEQASGSEVDHRADLYALGVMLYEMLKGEPPFQAEQMVALLVKHMTEEPPPLPPSIPPELADLVFSLLAKQVDQRPPSADALLSALRALLPPGVESPSRPSLASFGGRPGSMPWAPPPSSARPASQAAATLVPASEPAPGGAAASAAKALLARGAVVGQQALVLARRPVNLRGRNVPVGALAGALVAVLVLGWMLWPSSPKAALGSEQAAGTSHADSSHAPEGPVDPALQKVLDAARTGSDSALYALEQRKDDERTASEWLALAQARLMRRNVDKGLEAFGAAIAADARLGDDEVILGALRALTKEEKDATPILHFVAERLGAVGADFLFHVWAKTSAKNGTTTLAYELLDSRAVRAKRSEALRVAMALREAKDCSDFAALMPDIEKYGDQRSYSKVRDLELDKTRGCGATKKDDCYPCLHEGTALRDAMTQSGMRAAPQFELGRRFRFLR
ncbi:MAG TPA: serine/threonine-protein kinase [Polyangiaceae bacterium]|nr:serine/threonine-protein kinase [Polyangiaceae bacterium]